MSEAPTPPTPEPGQKSADWRSPQVILPIIATLSTVLVAIIGVLPAILEANKPAATPTPIVVVLVATTVPAEPTQAAPTAVVVIPTSVPMTQPTQAAPTAELVSTATPVPTLAPTLEPTLAPTDIPSVDAAPTAVPNITLFYDNDSFSILNASGSRASLEGITFRSSAASWDISPFGGLMKALPNNKCLRMRDASVGNRQPPAACGSTMYGFLEIGPKVMFWKNVDQFEVVRNGTVIATCEVALGTCPIYVEQ
jgi:hypothetical protein